MTAGLPTSLFVADSGWQLAPMNVADGHRSSASHWSIMVQASSLACSHWVNSARNSGVISAGPMRMSTWAPSGKGVSVWGTTRPFLTIPIRALEEGHKIWQKRLTPALIESVLAQALDDLESRLTRHGYHARALADLLWVRPADIHAFLAGRLPTSRTQELQQELLAAGLPL
jgi:hypothetical protein